jgi:hypothetical protein
MEAYIQLVKRSDFHMPSRFRTISRLSRSYHREPDTLDGVASACSCCVKLSPVGAVLMAELVTEAKSDVFA